MTGGRKSAASVRSTLGAVFGRGTLWEEHFEDPDEGLSKGGGI